MKLKVFDAHCDTVFQATLHGGGLRRRRGHLDLERLAAFGHGAQFFACFAEPEDFPGRDLWEVFQEEAALFHREMAANADLAVHCVTAAQAEAAWRDGKVAAFLSAEGAELVSCDPERLHAAYALGVRCMNVTWNHVNALAGTNVEEPHRGLTPQGKEFVREMDRLGMLVDVSHLSDPGFWDVCAETKGPIIATHSNSRRCHFHTRNLTDEEFTAIIEKKGVAGLNLCAEFVGEPATLDGAIRHIEHFLELGGEDSLALGGDWDGVRHLPAGIAGVQDWRKLYDALLGRNYPVALVDKLFSGNLMRVVRDVCGM